MDKPLLSLKNLSAHYSTPQGKKIYAVNNVSLDIYPNEVIGLAGESGCGKSTLIQAAMGLFFPPLQFASGEIRFNGQDVMALRPEERRKNYLGSALAIIPQSALNALNPTQKIGMLAMHIVRSHKPTISKKEINDLLVERLADMGLSKQVVEMYPMELSGGMKQRVVIALSTLLNPKVVIADEPTSALDVSSQKEVIELILKLMDKSIISSLIFITHELALLKHIAHKIGVMYGGEIVEWGLTNQILHTPRHPYSKALIESVLLPDLPHRQSLPTPLTGAPPNLTHIPNQCLFAERCSRPQENCFTYRQTLRQIDHRLVRCEYA